MDLHQRTRSNTTIANNQSSTNEHKKRRDSISTETKSNNRTSLTLESSTSMNNPTGKSWKKLFSHQHSKQISSGTTSEFDITYITPRLIVMTTQRENFSDVSSHLKVESIQNLFDTKHPNSYMIYTLDQSSNEQLSHRKELFHKRVIDLPLFDEKQSPRLVGLLWFCQKITLYLLESPLNVAVLHCIDERNQLAFGACSLLAYHQIFSRVDQILEYYQSKRCAHIILTMSQKRYIQYLCDLSFDIIERPHFNQLIIQAIHLTPVPLVNKQKTGCRPFVDIYDQNHTKIFSTHQEISKLKVYSAADSHCLIPINLPFNGDLTIHITHAAIGHSRQIQDGGIRICELTINSNFSRINQPDLIYLRNQLDGIDHNEKHPTLFSIKIQIINPSTEIFNQQDSFIELLNKTLKQRLILFQDENQFQRVINKFDDMSFFSVIDHRRKSKDESISLISTSPQPNSNSISSGFILNPRYTSFQQQQPLSEIFPSSSSFIEENSTLLDLQDKDSFLEKSSSSDKQQNSNFDSQINLLDTNFDSDISNNSSTQIILPTTIPKPNGQKLSSPITQVNTSTTNTPNYNINLVTNNPFSSQQQSNVSRSNSSTSPPEKSKIDIYQYFIGVGDLGKDPQIHSETSIPNTIGAARKASLAKDIDPTVLKVREWTEGKKGNLRALLCSLASVTWPECTWSGCQMHELLTDEQVKKIYRKAVLHIHPDKLHNNPNEELAKLIFMELNEAWSLFENRN